MPSPSDPARTGLSPSVLDETALGKLRELDPEGRAGIVARVLRTYETSLLRTLASLAEAGQAADVTEVRHHAHTLKSSSASVGALALSALCAQAEALAREARASELPPVLQALQEEGQRVMAAVQAMLAA